MNSTLRGWMVAGLLLGTTVYALAEDITLTTYYPSPRGVYNEVRARDFQDFDNILFHVDPTGNSLLTNLQLTNLTLTGTLTCTGCVGTDNIANGAVTNPKLAPDAVTTDKIFDRTIQTFDIGLNQVTQAEIAPASCSATGDGGTAVKNMGGGALGCGLPNAVYAAP